MTANTASTLLSPEAAVSPPVPDLNQHTYAQWRDYILPSPDELAWQAVSWRASFGAAVTEAQRTEKPILLWAMNGHPLACT